MGHLRKSEAIESSSTMLRILKGNIGLLMLGTLFLVLVGAVWSEAEHDPALTEQAGLASLNQRTVRDAAGRRRTKGKKGKKRAAKRKQGKRKGKGRKKAAKRGGKKRTVKRKGKKAGRKERARKEKKAGRKKKARRGGRKAG